jgi:iron complex outermembrane receptor protein
MNIAPPPKRVRRALLLSTAILAAPTFAAAQSASPAQTAEAGASSAAAAATAAQGAAVASTTSELVVTARHRVENVEKVPVSISVISGDFLAKTDTQTIAQIAQLEPSVQFAFFNPRNANINIRGLGANIGLANDGLDPGVGFYVDGVYYARPAGATFDLEDIGQIDVLRGPQGTLFGRNTTAGAINVTTLAPSFHPEATGEITGGNLGDLQAKASVSGPLSDTLAGRLAVSSTEHDGYLTNADDGKKVNDERDLNIRGQLLYSPDAALKVRVIADYNKQASNCCDLVLGGIVAPTNGKNFAAIAGSQGYTPVVDPFNRQANSNAFIQARQEQGGLSSEIDYTLPGATLTSITAWRFWNWWPANDSDYTPLSVLNVSQNGDKEDQYSQELRIASRGENRIDYVAGLYVFDENIHAIGETQYGSSASAFLLGATLPAVIANGYTLNYNSYYYTQSYAAFGQAVWHVTSQWNLTAGLRYTDDKKNGDFTQLASGGASLTGLPAVLSTLRAALGTSAALTVSNEHGDLSGLIDLSYQATPDVLTYLTYARGYKSGGLNLTQLPAGASPVIQPESIDELEGGVKSQLFERRLTLNADLFFEDDKNYQANVYNTALGKQYLANVPEVRTGGLELDAQAVPAKIISLYGSLTWDDAVYASYPNGICGLEAITLPTCNLSGRPLAGVPRWALATGGELHRPVDLGNGSKEAYIAADYNYRSSVYSAATDSIYTKLPQLSLVNLRLGLRDPGRWDIALWARNLLNENYFTFLSPGVGNTGALYAQLGDPRTYGITLRVHY